MKLRAVISLVVASAALALLGAGIASGIESRPSGALAPNLPTASGGAAHRRAAVRDAKLLLGRLVLPAGAQRLAREPAHGSALAQPGSRPLTSALVDRHAWWRLPGKPASVFSYLAAHPPRGATQFMEGSIGKSGRLVSRTIGFAWPAVPGVLSSRWLIVEVSSLGHRTAGVRADAEVVWTVPRPATERVPHGARVLDVRRSAPDELSLTVTDLAKVREIAAMLDRLPIVQPGIIACPAIFPAPTVTFTFRATASGPALAKASMLANGPAGACSPIEFSIRGRSEKPLSGQPSWLQKAGKVLGVSLSESSGPQP